MIKNFDVEIFRDKIGFEIGGKSAVFSRGSDLPIYAIAQSIDNCNFGIKDEWNGEIELGNTFKFDSPRPAGKQFLMDGVDLYLIEKNTYDFVLASHVLEHIANPIKALSEWIRILKKDGMLAIIVPDKEKTFDANREITTLQHMIRDYELGVEENDLSHIPEIINMHKYPEGTTEKDKTEFMNRSVNNFSNRGLHHHVFDTYTITGLAIYMGLGIVATEYEPPYNIVTVIRRTK